MKPLFHDVVKDTLVESKEGAVLKVEKIVLSEYAKHLLRTKRSFSRMISDPTIVESNSDPDDAGK